MKHNTLIKAAMLTLVMTTSVAATSAHAGSKQKPPIAETTQASSWYDSILSFFSF
ncbi:MULTISPECIES: hypothetical protein [Alteromonadaceae]|uniref:hypothetical protein n=1 Tax=Alteromonadaceae TaxID=72275 RepID=UPI001C08E1FF|nr:hypothetical protein [Aliiglaciecola lipolytica]MBU2879879.1 hypothetical protein [Aliiglaciecola lipolytica]MBU2879880.1 hypothetical protein [Aliiglaciecola lipolytica]MBU2879881.1 hypothetical protein [Aliiglaciecola lipolytica]MBU2879882.1 hypothetical protein [Aliiglaciecola lipolytica]